MRWKTLAEQPIDDIVAFVRAAAKDGQTVVIGTDSLQSGKYTHLCCVAVIYSPGKGGRAAYSRESFPRINSLRERLQKEAWCSVSLGLAIAPYVNNRVEIHLDVNTEPRYRSSQFAQELVGLVMGQGFRAVVKPDSWCSTTVADHAVRGLVGKANAKKEVA